MFRLELIVHDAEERARLGRGASIGIEHITASEEQIETAVKMMRITANKLEEKIIMGLTKFGAAEPLEPEATDTAKEASAEPWTDQDAAALAAENEDDNPLGS